MTEQSADSVHCPRCQSAAKPDARFCSRCGLPLKVQPTTQPSSPPSTWQNAPSSLDKAHVVLHIVMPKMWHLTDTDLDIFLDGQHMGHGSMNKGVDLHAATTPGNHILEIGADVMAVGGAPLSSFSTQQFRKTWKMPLNVLGPGAKTARIKYSRAWGNFKVEEG